MPKFVIPFSCDLLIETDTVDEAISHAHAWRKFVMQSLRGRLEEFSLNKIVIGRIHSVTEVDDEWLRNKRLKEKYKKEWEYIEHHIAVKSLDG